MTIKAVNQEVINKQQPVGPHRNKEFLFEEYMQPLCMREEYLFDSDSYTLMCISSVFIDNFQLQNHNFINMIMARQFVFQR